MDRALSVWFSDYDTKRSKLFRAALTLRNESWSYTQSPTSALWWIVDTTEPYDANQLIHFYHLQPQLPVIILLNADGSNEYHPTWASLRVPMNFIRFFSWMEHLLSDPYVERNGDEDNELIRRFQGESADPKFVLLADVYESSNFDGDDYQQSLSEQEWLDADAFSLLETVSQEASQAKSQATSQSASQLASEKTSDDSLQRDPPPTQQHLHDGQLVSSDGAFSMVDQVIGDAQPWTSYRFKMLTWPNVAQFGYDMKLVLVCSKMLRSPLSYSELQGLGLNDEVLSNVIADAYARRQLLFYVPVTQVTELPEDLSNITVKAAANVPVKADEDAMMHEQLETVPEGQHNKNSLGLFQSIINFFRKKI